ncbi:hypothetical protein B0H13DRAFT_2412744 [Mycena leptocephala]|nr:hypothetical protein B0H13DRAFT_2412744 [Mycena leptocephala]
MPNKAANLMPFLCGRIYQAAERVMHWKENRRKTANPWGRAKRLTAAIQVVRRIRRAPFPFFSHGRKESLNGTSIADPPLHCTKHDPRLYATGPFKRMLSLRAESTLRISDSGSLDSPNSIESFGCLIRAGIDDPFGYGDLVPRSDDDESSFDDYFDDSEVDDTFSFLHPGVIKAQNWPFACFLYNVFRTKDINGKLVNRSQTHGQMVSAFLAGRGKRTVANIVNEWMKDPLGRIPRYSSAESLMFSTTIPFTEIGPVRAALTTFSTQTIGKKVGEEAENAVKLTSGLHVASVIEREQPVTVYMFDKIGMRKPRKRNGVVLERKIRPPKGVITHTISALNFCRTDQANLLPLARGILYFGSSAPIELMNYNSRIGKMPSYSTVRHALLELSAQEALDTAAHGKDPMKAGFLLIDSCQNRDKQRDLRIGRESVMNVGMSGLYMEAPDIDVDIFDLEDKRKHVEQNLGKHLTVDQLLGFIDQADNSDRTHGRNARFLKQVGQTPDDYLKRKIPV